MNDKNIGSYEIQHLTKFEYEFPIQWAAMLLRLQPRKDEHQIILQFDYEITPSVNPIAINDAFGNACHLLSFQSVSHSSISVVSNARVRARTPSPTLSNCSQMTWEDLQSRVDGINYWDYLAPSRRVYDCPQLQNFMTEHHISRVNKPFAALMQAAKTIFQRLRYEPGATEVNTKIEDCLQQRSGVCQDFTHILLAIGRKWGIPSRYVSGYLHLYPNIERVITDSASHAWGEFYFPECGWVGIDATNDTMVDHRYIRVSVGRDYEDAAPTKGVVYGGGSSSLNVNITLIHRPAERSGTDRYGMEQQQ